MEMRTILAAVSGGSASAGVVEMACRMARLHESHVEFYHVRVDPRDMLLLPADGFSGSMAADLITAALNEATRTAAAAHALCDAAIERHGLLRQDAPTAERQASASWREETGNAALMLAARARLFDLLVLGRSGRVVDEPYSDSIEETLLTAGRPVLVAPSAAPSAFGETIAVAWNDSPESARALDAAIPFLVRAKAVCLLSVGETNGAAVVEQLGWYGVRATASMVDRVENTPIGALLLAAARDRGADLLVMGSYSKSPLRQMLFGGATRQVVGTSLLPLLLAH